MMHLLQFKVAVVVMGRPKYLPDDGDHVLNLDDFQPPHWQGRSRAFDGTLFTLIIETYTVVSSTTWGCALCFPPPYPPLGLI